MLRAQVEGAFEQVEAQPATVLLGWRLLLVGDTGRRGLTSAHLSQAGEEELCTTPLFLAVVAVACTVSSSRLFTQHCCGCQ